LQRLFRILRWVWAGVILSGIIGTAVNLMFADFRPEVRTFLSQWWLLALALLTILAALTFFSWRISRAQTKNTEQSHHGEVEEQGRVLPKVFNVPYERNPFFTGRNEKIKELRDSLVKNSAGALAQAISGLGGIGKTQIAIEYAYRYRGDYDAVLWVDAETDSNLKSSFLEIATTLNLPGKDAKDINEVVNAVKRWLETNSGWLIIYDNADSPELIKPYRPRNSMGHILLTSRAQVFQTLGDC
jgi:NB-ARC domain